MQGLKLDSVVINSDYEFTGGLLYTALSRVRNSKDAQLINFNPSHLRDRSDELDAIDCVKTVLSLADASCCKQIVPTLFSSRHQNVADRDLDCVEELEVKRMFFEAEESYEANLEDLLQTVEKFGEELLELNGVDIVELLDKFVDKTALVEGKLGVFSRMKNEAISALKDAGNKEVLFELIWVKIFGTVRKEI